MQAKFDGSNLYEGQEIRSKTDKSVNSNYFSIDPWHDLNDLHCPLPNTFLDSDFHFQACFLCARHIR